MPEGNVFHGRDDRHAHQAGKAREVFSEHRVALVRHGGRALLAGREELFRFQNLGTLHVADFDGDVFDRRGDDAERREEHGVTVTWDDLRRNRLRDKAELFADMFFDARVDISEGADGAGDRAGGDFRAGIHKALTVAVHLGIEAGKGQAHGCRLGMDAMAAADAHRVLVFEGAGLQRGEYAVHVGEQ